MKRFALKIGIFLFPIIFIYLCPFIVLLQSGEFVSISHIIERQISKENVVVFGLGYSNPNRAYKLASVQRKRPDVLVLGSSRVMQFRSRFVKEGVTLFTAGGAIESPEDLNIFINLMPDGYKPKILIVGLDHNWFNENDDCHVILGDVHKSYRLENDYLTIYFQSFQKVYIDFFEGKYTFDVLSDLKVGPEFVGMTARAKGNGFRNDGSYRYNKYIEGAFVYKRNKEPDYGVALDRISSGGARFRYGKNISQKKLDDLQKFLEYCRYKNIYVVGFLPPYASKIYNKMLAMNDKYAFIPKVYPALNAVFNKSGFICHDFSDLSSLGASDWEIIDGFHGSEKAYLRLFSLLAQRDSNIAVYCDYDFLLMKLRQTKGDHDVFGDAI